MKVNPIIKSALIASVDKVLSKTFSNGITLMVRRTTPEKKKLNAFTQDYFLPNRSTEMRLVHRIIAKVCRMLASHFEEKMTLIL